MLLLQSALHENIAQVQGVLMGPDQTTCKTISYTYAISSGTYQQVYILTSINNDVINQFRQQMS